MLKLLIPLLLCAGSLFGAFDSASNVPYCVSCTLSAPHTTTGTNNVIALAVWVGSGGVGVGTPTYGGVSMGAAVASHAITLTFPGLINWYVLTGVAAGTATVSFTCDTGGCAGTVFSFNNAKQSGQPDAISTFTNATSTTNTSPTTNCGGGFDWALLPIVVSANNSWVVGWFGSMTNLINTRSPTDNATSLAAADQDAGIGYSWWSTNAISSGSFTLHACVGGTGATYNSYGISIAPLAPTFISNPTIITVGP